MTKKNEGFSFVVVNNTTKEFNVYSNIFDDTNLTDAVAEAQQKKQDVRCFTDPGTSQHVIEQYQSQGYVFTTKRLT